MNPIDQAILQEEIRNALNALFVNGQVGRSNKVVLEWNDKKTYETMETADERGTVAKVSNTAIDPATVKSVCFVAKDATTGAILAEEIAGADTLTTAPCNACGTLVVSTAGATVLWIVTAEDVANVSGGDAMVGTWFCNARNDEASVTVTMTAVTETIHPIDPKFLPGVCLPVVELETVVDATTGEEAVLTDAECALLDSHAETGFPIIIAFVVDQGEGGVAKFRGIFSHVQASTYTSYITSFAGMSAQIYKYTDSDQWYAMLSGV